MGREQKEAHITMLTMILDAADLRTEEMDMYREAQ